MRKDTKVYVGIGCVVSLLLLFSALFATNKLSLGENLLYYLIFISIIWTCLVCLLLLGRLKR